MQFVQNPSDRDDGSRSSVGREINACWRGGSPILSTVRKNVWAKSREGCRVLALHWRPKPTMLGTIKDVSQILANAATILVAVAAAFWFFRSRRYSKRVEFNVEFNVFESGDPKSKILQLNLMLDNKGQVEHHCYILAYEVAEMRADGTCVADKKEGFIFRSGNIVEKDAEYYYVRPGVCQRIVTTIPVPNTVKLAKVRAFFTYRLEGPKI